MNDTIDLYIARCLMIDRLQYRKVDVEFQIRQEKENNPSINNEKLATLNVLLGVLEREINELLEMNNEDRLMLYTDTKQ